MGFIDYHNPVDREDREALRRRRRSLIDRTIRITVVVAIILAVTVTLVACLAVHLRLVDINGYRR